MSLKLIQLDAAEVINAVSAELGVDDLVSMNARSVEEQLGSATIASDWLREKGLI